jgi:hypothetical protein
MSYAAGTKISFVVSLGNGDTYGDFERKLFRGLQTLVMPNVISMALSTPPSTSGFLNAANAYVVGSSPSGAWAGQANSIAVWSIDPQDGTVTTGAWEFYAPQAGWVIYDNNTNAFWTWSGSAWVLYKAAPKLAVTATSTTTLSPVSNSSFRIALNNQATVSLVINAGAYDGQEITILYVQGGSTGSTVTAATNVHGFTTPSAGLNSVSVQRFTWDLTNTVWYALSAGTTGM